MSSFFAKPWVQKVSRYTAAYTLTAAMAIAALLLALRVHTTIMDVLVFAGARDSTAYAVRIWGAFLLFIGYAVFIALLEPHMNRAVGDRHVIKSTLKISAVEFGIFLLTILVPLLLDFIWRLR
jgi:hypothetical protein